MKHLTYVCLILIGAGLVYHSRKMPAPSAVEPRAQHLQVVQPVNFLQAAAKVQPPALAPTPAKPVRAPAPTAPDLSLEESTQLEGLPRGHRLLTKVRALPEASYQAEVGMELLRKDGLVFFRHEGPLPEAAHVVYDRGQDTVHPVSSVIRVEEVNEARRQELTARFREYHYNRELRILYLQSSHEDLLQEFAEVRASDAGKASLEVIQGRYETR
jgi:hypothetical protein